MAKLPNYRLQTLIGLRERAKEKAEQNLAVCLKALKEEEERLKALEKELRRMISDRRSRRREYTEKVMRGEMSAQAAMSAETYIKRLKELEELQREAIANQKEVVAQRQEDVTAARQDLTKAAQELKALEKHKEKWLSAVRKEIAAKEADAMDELAQTIFLDRGKS